MTQPLISQNSVTVKKKRAGFLLFHFTERYLCFGGREPNLQHFSYYPALSLILSLSLFASMCLFVHLSLCPSVTMALMYLSFFQIFFLCVCISASLFLYISLFHPLCLCLYPPVSFVSLKPLCVFLCLSPSLSLLLKTECDPANFPSSLQGKH